MSVAEVRKTVVQIINEVERRLAVDASTSAGATKLSTMLVDLLNDTIDEVSDAGDWQEMLREAKVTAVASVASYEIAVSGNIKNILEISWGDDIASLDVVSIEDILRLQRVRRFGAPRQYAIVGVSGVNPIIRPHPIPNASSITAEASAGGVFTVVFYKKPILFGTADTSAIPAFPAKVLVQGLYAKALLEENGGEPTREYEMAYAEYLKARTEAANRLTTDTGTDIYLVPG